MEPSTSVAVNGVAAVVLLTTRSSPEGTVARLAETVRGWRSIVSVSLIPELSVAVNASRRNEGYSWSGALNEPLETP